MAIVPTVKVIYRNGGHSAFINVSDFDPNLHELFVDTGVAPVLPLVDPIDVTVEKSAEEIQAQEEKAAKRAAAVAKAQAAAKAAREKKKADKEAAVAEVKEEPVQ
jgi:hypothetical protein